MKKQTALIIILFLALLSACNNPIVIPANLAVTLPANQDFLVSATAPGEQATLSAPGAESAPAAQATASPTLQPSATATNTPTFTPIPTRKLPYPAGLGTPIIDLGFAPIGVESASSLTTVFNASEAIPRHFAISGNGEKLFLGTSDGLFAFDRQGQVLAHWPQILTPAQACESCLSSNIDGSRLAVMTRSAGAWEARVYAVQDSQASLFLSLPVGSTFLGVPNEASIAISPDDTFLAFKAGAGPLRVLDLNSALQVFSYERPVNGLLFSAAESFFVIHAGQEMLFYDTKTWKQAANLLLPRENAAYAFSPDEGLMAVALPTKMRVYAIPGMRQVREINVQPSNALERTWMITFLDETTLSGYSTWWDAPHLNASLQNMEWDVLSGETLRTDTSTSQSPDALAALWGAQLALPSGKGQLEPGAYAHNAFRFLGESMLLINSPHSACWYKLLSAENTCFADSENVLFASDGNAFSEVLQKSSTSLVDRSGAVLVQVGPYRIAAVNRSGEWALVNNGLGTDLYTKGKKLPQESVNGVLQGFAENAKYLAFTTLQKENSFTITVVDKTSGNAVYQEQDNFLYKPLLMTAAGAIYYIQNELDRNQTVLNMLDLPTRKISELTRVSLPAKPTSLALSLSGVFAIGQKDGAVLLMTQDGAQSAAFQAAASAIESLSFSSDGRFLAVASAEGLRIFALLPGR